MNAKHRKILEQIFKDPIQSNVKWSDVEKLFIGFGAEITEGNGSRAGINHDAI